LHRYEEKISVNDEIVYLHSLFQHAEHYVPQYFRSQSEKNREKIFELLNKCIEKIDLIKNNYRRSHVINEELDRINTRIENYRFSFGKHVTAASKKNKLEADIKKDIETIRSAAEKMEYKLQKESMKRAIWKIDSYFLKSKNYELKRPGINRTLVDAEKEFKRWVNFVMGYDLKKQAEENFETFKKIRDKIFNYHSETLNQKKYEEEMRRQRKPSL